MSENLSKRKNFIVIGLGSMGTRRVKHCLEQKYDVTGYDLRYDRTQRAKDELEIQVVENFLEIENLVQLNRVNGVFIDTPPAEHFRYIQYCIDNHINFFVEQPAVHTRTSLELCKNIVADREVCVDLRPFVMQVSTNLRFSKIVKKLRELFESDNVSQPLYAFVECAEYLPDWHPYEPYTDYYPSNKNMGGGLDVICDVDWLNYLFGNFQLKNKVELKKSSLKIDTPDIMQYTFTFEGSRYNGLLVTIYEDLLQRTPIHTAKFITENEVIYADFINNNITIDNGKLREIKIINIKEDNFSTLSSNNKKWNWVEESYYLESLEFFNKIDKQDTSLTSFKNELYKLSQIL